MKKTAVSVLAILIMCIAAVTVFAACSTNDGDTPSDDGISMEEAESVMISYLRGKGFEDGDFLAEGTVMELDGVRVYAFSWRTKVNENADKLFGTYAVSTDGKSFYEYQSLKGDLDKGFCGVLFGMTENTEAVKIFEFPEG